MATADTSQVVLYEQKFSQNFELLAQQQDARFPQTFKSQGNHRGSKGAQAVKQIAARSGPKLRVARFEPIVLDAPAHDARWVNPSTYHDEIGFDTWDELQTASDPRSMYMQALMASFNRQKDDIALAAMIADAKSGETGSDTTSFDTSGQNVAVDFGSSGTNTHLTLGKIKEAKKILLANEVDLETEALYVSARAIDIDSLMDEIQVVHQDYQAGMTRNAQPVLRDGTLKSVFGVNIIHSERHATTGNDTELFMYASSAMHWGVWQDVTTKIVQRDNLVMHPWQLSCWGSFGAVRLQEKKIVRILSITA